MAGSSQEPLRGHLWKRSPSKLKLYRYQWRFVLLDGGKLYWWRNVDMFYVKGVDGCCGFVDLQLNCCKVQRDARHPCRFTVIPGFLSWHKGQFTGADACRIFYFDAAESEFSRETWMRAMECHCQARLTSAVELVELKPDTSSFSRETHEPVVAEIVASTDASIAAPETEKPVEEKAETSIAADETGETPDWYTTADEGPASGDARPAESIPAASGETQSLDDAPTATSSGLDSAGLAKRSSLVTFAVDDDITEVPSADAEGSEGPLTFCMQDSEPTNKRNSLEARYDALDLLGKAADDELHHVDLDVPETTEVYEIYDDELSSDDGAGGPESCGEEDDNLRQVDRSRGKRTTLSRHYEALDAGQALGTVAAHETESFSERGTAFGSTKSEVTRRGSASAQSALQVVASRGRACTEGSALSQAKAEVQPETEFEY
mmetsp:Transcript_20650/g.39190  ORF Transcript_20650/g.39190 Transcript_20650/m.39190 type:complete len:435 (-) Transcript_20650:38-1342(-)